MRRSSAEAPSIARTGRKLTPGDVETYLRSLLESGRRPQTAKNHHALLRSALAQAERWRVIDRNVAKLVKPPRVPHYNVRPLTAAQAQEFLVGVRDDRLGALYAISLSLGLRQGEALGLQWADVNFDDRTLEIRHTLQRYARQFHLDEPKTDRSRRTISLPEPLIEALRQHKTRQLFERERVGDLWAGARWGLVFCDEVGLPLDGSAVTRGFQRKLAELGLPRQRFHDMRHAAGSFLIAQGVPLRVVMEILGHSTIATTANIYGHVLPELVRDATDRTAAVLFGTS